MSPRRPAPAVVHPPAIVPLPQQVAQQNQQSIQQAIQTQATLQQAVQPGAQQVSQGAPAQSANLAQQKNLNDLKGALSALKASLAARSEKHAAFTAALAKTESALGAHPAEEKIHAILSQDVAKKIAAEKSKTQ